MQKTILFTMTGLMISCSSQPPAARVQGKSSVLKTAEASPDKTVPNVNPSKAEMSEPSTDQAAEQAAEPAPEQVAEPEPEETLADAAAAAAVGAAAADDLPIDPAADPKPSLTRDLSLRCERDDSTVSCQLTDKQGRPSKLENSELASIQVADLGFKLKKVHHKVEEKAGSTVFEFEYKLKTWGTAYLFFPDEDGQAKAIASGTVSFDL